MIRRGLLLVVFACLSSAQAPIRITVHADKPVGKEVPNTVFGTFLEPIGNSTYNGLWAELIQNPSLESGLWSARAIREMITADPQLVPASQLGLPLPWEPLYVDEGNRYEPKRGDAANSFESIAVLGLPDRETGIRQMVFLPIHRELNYRGSLFIRHLSGSDVVRVSLRKRDRPDQTLAVTEVHGGRDVWTKYPFELSLTRGQLKPLEPADFVISVAGDERTVVDQISLMPADAIEGLDPDMVRMAREMQTPLLRFGGNFTSGYNWRDGVGPEDKRISMRNIAWGIPETNQFGTDEFLHFCDLIGAQPQVALNLGTGTPEDAAEWVRYVNEHWKKHSGLLWELGNELWGDWNNGYPTLSELAGRTLRFSQAVKKVDPDAKLIATGQDPDKYDKWNATELQDPPGTFDFLSTHFVVTTDHISGNDRSPDAIALDTFALPVGLERKLHDMQKQIDTAGRPNVHIAFTEWLFVCCAGNGNEAPRFDNFGGAIAAGGFLNMLLRNSNVVPISDMTGIIEFAGIWKKRSQVFAAPAYYAFRMFSTAQPKRALQVDNDSPTYDVHGGISRLPEINAVPYLDVVAVQNATTGGISLFGVNRNLNQDLEAEITIDGANVAEPLHVQELFAPSLYAVNDEVRPEAIAPRASVIQMDGSRVRFVFRRASISRIDFRLK